MLRPFGPHTAGLYLLRLFKQTIKKSLSDLTHAACTAGPQAAPRVQHLALIIQDDTHILLLNKVL